MDHYKQCEQVEYQNDPLVYILIYLITLISPNVMCNVTLHGWSLYQSPYKVD